MGIAQATTREICGGHGQKSSDIANEVAHEIRAGDLVLVKGSLGTDMASIINVIHALNSRGSDTSKPLRGVNKCYTIFYSPWLMNT